MAQKRSIDVQESSKDMAEGYSPTIEQQMYQDSKEAIDDCSQSEAEVFDSISEENKPLLPIGYGSQDIDSISEGNKPLLLLGTGSQNIDSISEENKPLLPIGYGSQDIDSISEENKPLLPIGYGSQNIDSISEENKPLLPIGYGSQDIDLISEENKPLLPIGTGCQDIDSISEGNKPLLPLGTGSQNIDSISDENIPLLPMGAGNQDIDPFSEENIPLLPMGTGSQDKTQFQDNVNECANKNRTLQERDSNTRVLDFDDNSFGDVVTDVNDLGKPDLLKGEMFPKFSNVKKIKTRYGKVKIHYTDSLDADEEERIVKESVKLLKRFKDEDIEAKKIQKEYKLQRQNNGSRIGNCFRFMSCVDRADE